MGIVYAGVKIRCALKFNALLNQLDRLIGKSKRKNETNMFAKLESQRNLRFMSKLPDMEESQKIIETMMDKDTPYSVIRFGLYEYILCRQFLEIQNHLRKDYSDFIKYHINIDAGMFSNESCDMDEYARLILENLSFADVVAYWRNYPEKLVCGSFFDRKVKHIPVESLYPYPFLHPNKFPSWQQKLKGKKVLVVSAFAKTVEKQYEKRLEIWKEKVDEILPVFNLISFQAVQTCGAAEHEKYDNWRSAFDDMLYEILHIDFDIALISCGSYGMPLALELKKAGRSAIQWGGCFQLWFGIMGKRWQNDEAVLSCINEAWTYPDESEVPPMAKLVGDGSYWKS